MIHEHARYVLTDIVNCLVAFFTAPYNTWRIANGAKEH